ncbi:hypothetical protein GH714_014336 [Hevea brasiliensis]|uniref:Cyclin-dependent kinase inhibitor domain-containing protein n=1 Tax=Hevea brasiliensis TaxID=3981 RepID=A0A6A6K4V3_HEVBR|nr:hypothetical protein GH714_014336 [Hevea brasiliensis]
MEMAQVGVRTRARALALAAAAAATTTGTARKRKAESVEVETSVYYSCRERKETTPSSQLQPVSSGELDSTERPSSEANSRRRSTAEKMPTEFELDEFFAVAEKNLKKQFADKYNYDIVKDEPLEGRYEWLRLKP